MMSNAKSDTLVYIYIYIQLRNLLYVVYKSDIELIVSLS